MVTYKYATEVFRYRCVNQQAKKVYSRAIILQHVNQTNKLNELNSTLSFCFSISLTTEGYTSNQD